MKKWWLIALSLPAIAGILWIVTKNAPDPKAPARPKPARSVAPEPLPETTSVPRQTVATASVMPTVKTLESVLPAEPMPMKDLRELLDKDPAAALVVARKDLAKDPNGPDAAERNWVVVKSLAVLGRFEEAKREAEIMVEKFPGTSWANDVERHVLAHP